MSDEITGSLEDASAALLLDGVDEAGGAGGGLARPERVPLRVPADLVLYAAFLGRPPEIDPSLADPLVVAANARRERPWSPVVLSLYLRQVYRAKGLDGLVDLAPPGLKIHRPELTAWVRRRSIGGRRFPRLSLRRAG